MILGQAGSVVSFVLLSDLSRSNFLLLIQKLSLCIRNALRIIVISPSLNRSDRERSCQMSDLCEPPLCKTRRRRYLSSVGYRTDWLQRDSELDITGWMVCGLDQRRDSPLLREWARRNPALWRGGTGESTASGPACTPYWGSWPSPPAGHLTCHASRSSPR